jgi:hypothetical protein
MPRVHVATDALKRLGAALVKFDARAAQDIQAFEVGANQALVSAATHLGECQRELTAARNALAHADKHTVAACRARVDAAERRLETADRAHKTIQTELDRVRAVRRRFTSTVSDTVGRATAELRKMGADVERYAAGVSGGGGVLGGGGGGPSPSASGGAGGGGGRGAAPGRSPGAPGQLAGVLAAHGRELVDIDDISLGEFEHRALGEGKLPDADRRWAIEMWESLVADEIDHGATFEDLEAMDRSRGATGHRRLAGVWDTFLGSDPVVVDVGPNGSVVRSGIHRVVAARKLGVHTLPAEVRRVR